MTLNAVAIENRLNVLLKLADGFRNFADLFFAGGDTQRESNEQVYDMKPITRLMLHTSTICLNTNVARVSASCNA